MNKILLALLSFIASAPSFAATQTYVCKDEFGARYSDTYQVKLTVQGRDELAYGGARVSAVSIDGKNAIAANPHISITGRGQNFRVRDALGSLPHALEITPYLLNERRAFEFAVDYGVIEKISVIDRAKTDALPTVVILHERTGEIHVTRCSK